jgi:hypothetical protein
MGYNLYIGELKVTTDPEPGEHVYADLGVIRQSGEDLDAPVNSADHRWNEIYPSYTGWADFCRRVGLTVLFFEEYDGILVQHPGAFVLTQSQLDAFESAREKFKSVDDDRASIYDRRRLDWLCFWTKWALENCKVPVFANS